MGQNSATHYWMIHPVIHIKIFRVSYFPDGLMEEIQYFLYTKLIN
jgi:hypothetical protein